MQFIHRELVHLEQYGVMFSQFEQVLVPVRKVPIGQEMQLLAAKAEHEAQV